MNTSTPAARWRHSQGALKQSWKTTGRFQTYRVTEERPAHRPPSPHKPFDKPFAYLAACGYLIPAFASLALGPMTLRSIVAPFIAAVVLFTLLVLSERRPLKLGAQIAFIASGVALAWISPEHQWVFDVAAAAMWGTAVALQARGSFAPASSVTPEFFQS